jgi:hypothetical protein
MRKWLSNILMNQADSSPGGGAAPAATPQAQGAAPAQTPAFDTTSIAAAVAEQVRNSMFAELRRAGVLGGDNNERSQPKPKAGRHDEGAAPPPSVSTADVQKVAKFQRALGAAGFTSDQESIIETLFDVEKPEVGAIGEWVAAKAKALGITKGAGTGTTNPTGQVATPPAQPASNAGAPAGPSQFTEDTPLWKLSPEDRAAFIRQKGLTVYRQTLQQQLRGVRVTVRNR